MNKIEKRNGNNDVFIIGEMMEDFHYSHMVKEQKFYQGHTMNQLERVAQEH